MKKDRGDVVAVNPEEARLIKEARAFHLKKRLGQHFLVRPEVLETVANALEPSADDTIIEVGPGIGFLTRILARSGARIVAVDLDRESIEELEQLNLDRVEIKHGDILRFDLGTLDFFKRQPRGQRTDDAGQPDEDGLASREEAHPATVATENNAQPSRIKIIGNVPYQITGLIIGHILGEISQPSPWLPQVDNIVMTVQYEVALRMVANAGEEHYSKLSPMIRYFCEPELLMKVPPDAFYPPPAVNSAVVRLKPRKQPLVQSKNLHLMQQLIEAGFRQRRKMFRNSLSFLKLPQADIDRTFRQLNMDPQVRAERLSLQQFAMLADAFDELV